jgi:hypothetical protein
MSYDINFLRKSYIGSFVVLYFQDMTVPFLSGEQEMDVNVMVDGYVVDITEGYIHLGNTTENVSKSVRLDLVGIIEKHELTAEMMGALN